MKFFRGIKELLSFQGVSKKQGRRPQEEDLGFIRDAALVEDGGRLLYVGPEAEAEPTLKAQGQDLGNFQEVDLKASTVMPAFVEAHTHLVFAGDRQNEFELRNRGASYQEIAAQGGGILSTVKQTRAASEDELSRSAQERVNRFVRQGVSCLEIKSGYGLDKDTELKMLRAARSVKGPKVVTTFLGAHALPPEFSSHTDYLDYLEAEVLPEVARQKLADRVDIFIEKGFFEQESSKAYLKKAKESGFQVNIHADQLSLSGGTQLAVELGALSADHVIEISDSIIEQLSKSQTVAMLLPAADFYLKCPYPPARKLIDQGACVALATDFNPGSSPTQDLSLVGVLARLQMRMSLVEVLAAYTFGAARSLGLDSERGSLEEGKQADFVVLDGSWKELFYQIGVHPVISTYRKGELLKP